MLDVNSINIDTYKQVKYICIYIYTVIYGGIDGYTLYTVYELFGICMGIRIHNNNDRHIPNDEHFDHVKHKEQNDIWDVYADIMHDYTWFFFATVNNSQTTMCIGI